jgi:hypothetical protein
MARPLGATGKRRDTLENLLRQKFPEWNPVLNMAEMANDKELDPPLRLQACREVAAYMYPKLKAVEVNLDVQGDIKIGWSDTHRVQSETASSDTP